MSTDSINYSAVTQALKMAPGNPEKIARAKQLERDYNDTISLMFSEESGVSFIPVPTTQDVDRFDTRAKETNNPDDIARAHLIRDRFDYYEGEKTAHIDHRVLGGQLRTKLAEGTVTRADVKAAERYAKSNPTPDNIGLYTQIKRSAEEVSHNDNCNSTLL
ncbi:hypothetical protein [Paenibacillus taichungensis]|uniref:hypothetical protein n=1 Tax=Paenibacillus taichungensis TaxID=484184 RepID=UPI0028719187|nr:hypothetical protein [Paenibacillus taichungensis]MDR9748818.1 hypothetical protein [Paenibacillus taichungensis]